MKYYVGAVSPGVGCVCGSDDDPGKNRHRRCKFPCGSGISRKGWLFLILSGLATGASWLCYYKALQLGDVSKVVPIDKLSVVITLLLAFLLFHETATLKIVAGAVLITIGTLLMVL